MATLPGQRTQFTWALNQYNLSEDPERREHFAKVMAKYLKAAPSHGFTPEDIARGKSYPAEVDQYANEADTSAEEGISEEEALRTVERAVDTSDVVRVGDGVGIVYAYGYSCCPDRLKVGYTEGETVQRIAAQIGTSTPDKPMLLIEIKSNQCRALERAIQSTLETRGRKITGGGAEWFKVTREEVLEIYRFVAQP
jgi:hypothetical protein